MSFSYILYKRLTQSGVTKLSDLADDSTHRLVTDSEKSTWNNSTKGNSGVLDCGDFNTASEGMLKIDLGGF